MKQVKPLSRNKVLEYMVNGANYFEEEEIQPIHLPREKRNDRVLVIAFLVLILAVAGLLV